MSKSYIRTPVPVDGKRQDWPRVVAQDLNSILRGYIFTMFFVETPANSEVLWIHPVSANFSIPADWGTIITEGVTGYSALDYLVGTNPVATCVLTIQRKPVGAAWETIGTWSISTAGALTATTTGGDQIDFVRGDGFRAVAPSSADGTIASCAFTVIGKR